MNDCNVCEPENRLEFVFKLFGLIGWVNWKFQSVFIKEGNLKLGFQLVIFCFIKEKKREKEKEQNRQGLGEISFIILNRGQR